MQIEFEAKYPKINIQEIREKLKALGAELAFPEMKFARLIFSTPTLKKKRAWVRLRNEVNKNTMTFKIIQDENAVTGMKEVSFEISSIEAAKSFLEQLGLKQDRYEENLREEWKLGNIIFDIDTWPLIDPFLEIEAPSEELVKQYFKLLELDYANAYFGSSDILYKNMYGIDILKRKTLTFKDKE